MTPMAPVHHCAGVHLHDGRFCVFVDRRCTAVSGRVDHQEAAADQAHLLRRQAGQSIVPEHTAGAAQN